MALELFKNEIIIGTNEEYVMGYHVNENQIENVDLELSFASHSHSGRVKQVAISNNFLVSGGTDEFVRIFNLSTRREVGYFLPHEGTITCLTFHDSGFLFSGSEDGKINIFRTGKWELEKDLHVGSSGINDIAIHPSGKIALSISKDRKLITWDLMRGKRVFTSALKRAGECISWSSTGSHYLITSGSIMDIYDVETANIEKSIDFDENIYCFCFITNEFLLLGGEKNSLSLFNLPQEKEILSWVAHSSRIKCLVKLKSNSKEIVTFASGSSDGFIKIWSINVNKVDSAKFLGEIDTKSRIICMSVYSESGDANSFKKIKKTKKNTTVDFQKQKRKIMTDNAKKKGKIIKNARNKDISTKKKKVRVKLGKLEDKFSDLHSSDINLSKHEEEYEKFSSKINERPQRKTKVYSKCSKLTPRSSVKRVEKISKFRNDGQRAKAKKSIKKNKKNLKKKVNSEFCGKT